MELVDVKRSLWEVLQVNIIHGINFENDRQLQETRRFLEKCADAVSLSCELTDFLGAVAHLKGETLALAKKRHAKAARETKNLLEFREQSRKMGIQFQAHVKETYGSEEVLERVEPFVALNFKDDSVKGDLGDFDDDLPDDDFEWDLTSSYFEVLLQRWSEGNEVLADIAEQYWDYLPVEVQDYLLYDLEFQLNVIDASDCEISCKRTVEAMRTYRASVSRAENSISRAKALNESMPKVRLTELNKRCLTNSVSNKNDENKQNAPELTTSQDKGYTLEELLEGVTPENSHEATDWGKPVGNEVC